MSRFNDVPAFTPSGRVPAAPDADQIAATGDALPSGAHRLTEAQQRAWFGRVVFDAPVSWDGDAFVCKGVKMTPEEIAHAHAL